MVHRYFDQLKPGSFSPADRRPGTGLSTALGVKAANPKRPVVCLIGDGSFNLTGAGEARRGAGHGLPILIVMFNNQAICRRNRACRNTTQRLGGETNKFAGLNIAPCPTIQ
jgi:thiamine pyrophosphate-dependent acetolactate synthase large subunit-like protein